MYSIFISVYNDSELHKEIMCSLPVYRKNTIEEKADHYATYYSSGYSDDSELERKINYNHYYHYYLSHFSSFSSNDHNDYNKEKDKYVDAYILKRLKEEDVFIHSQMLINHKEEKDGVINVINVSVKLIPIVRLELSCVDIAEYFDELLLRGQSIDYAHNKIVWVNKKGDEWEVFTCIMKTENQYKIGISSVDSFDSVDNFFIKLTDLAKKRLEYLEKL